MSDEFVTDDTPLTGQETGGQLRTKLEEQIDRNKKLLEEVAALKSDQAKRAVSETWAKLKVPPKFQAAYLGDNKPEAIEKWWADISSLVNLEGSEVDEQPAETAEQREQREQIQNVQKATALGSEYPSSVDAGIAKARELRERQTPISKAELDAVFADLGVKPY